MNKKVLAIIHKEFLVISKEPSVYITLLIFPLIISVVLPGLLLMLGPRNIFIDNINGASAFVKNVDTNIIPANINAKYKSLYSLLTYFFLPLFLVIPIAISTIISSGSFVGEKENKTLEGLLFTPITDMELVLGKILSAAIPSILLTWLSMIIYILMVDLLGFKYFHAAILPNQDWLFMGMILAPLITFLSIALVIFVSAKVKTSKSAQSISMILILPIIGFVASEASGALLFGLEVEILLAGIIFILDGLALIITVKKLNRENMILSN